MKKTLRISAFILAVIMLCSGCGTKTVPGEIFEPEESPVMETDPTALEIESFMDKYINTDARPIAVMVDNDDKNARPHSGLNEAYLIYELVVEGGATRFMALYQGTDTPKIGPVRSSRHYFLDYVMENDAIYTHFGWSPRAMQDISEYGIDKINGVLGTDESIFWREEKFKGDWHSAYTSIANIKEKADKKGFKTTTDHKNSLKYSDTYFNIGSGAVADDITLRYSGFYNTGYIYNAEKQLYEKQINGNPHAMKSGELVEVKNIIIELIDDTSLGDGTDRRNVITTGSGKGYYITNGEWEEITWSKSTRRGNTTYSKADGTPLYINPGKTIINIISPSAQITMTKPVVE